MKKKPGTKKISIQNRLDKVFTKPPFGGQCFAVFLTGDAKEFLAAVVEQTRSGGYVNKTLTLSMLQDDFGVELKSTSTLRRHLEGRCSCERRAALRSKE